MTDIRPCKCENDFKDFELMYDGLEDTAWVTIDRDYQNAVEYASGAGRYYLRLGFSGYNEKGIQEAEIHYCPWCGKKLRKG